MDLGPNLVGFWMVWRSPCDAFVGTVAGWPKAAGYIYIYICIDIQLPEATPPPGLRTHRKAIARPSKNRPSWATNPFKNPPKWWPKSPKIDQCGLQISIKINQKSQKNPSKSDPEGVLGGLGAILAPRWHQEPKGLRKAISRVPSWEPCWDQKSSRERSKR